MNSKLLLLLTLFMVGCGKTKQGEDTSEQAKLDQWNRQYEWDEKFIHAGNAVVRASLDCLEEQIKSPTGSLRGPICRNFCQQNNELVYMQAHRPPGIKLDPSWEIRSESCAKRGLQ